MLNTKAYRILGPWRGQLAILPRPRGGDWLEDDVRSWRETEVDVIVSLLTPSEIDELELSRESFWCKTHQIEFCSFPILDCSVPDSMKLAMALISHLDERLSAGQYIAVHCRQGIGRSGLIVAALLIAAGVEFNTAWEAIRVARGCEVPDTNEQREWVRAFGTMAALQTNDT